jgi:hypothetical protein
MFRDERWIVESHPTQLIGDAQAKFAEAVAKKGA